MKRFGMYDDDFNNLFERYCDVNQNLRENRFMSAIIQEAVYGSTSYPDLSNVKVFVQRPGRGADLVHQIDVKSINSDDGDMNTMLTGTEGDKTFNITTTPDSAQIKTVDQTGNVENDFVTRIKPRFDSDKKELIIIHVEEL